MRHINIVNILYKLIGKIHLIAYKFNRNVENCNEIVDEINHNKCLINHIYDIIIRFKLTFDFIIFYSLSSTKNYIKFHKLSFFEGKI